jgi:hypothetical protein
MWSMGTDKDGYGRMFFNGKYRRTHQIAWIITHGPIPEGHCVCHTCDTPGCVRPDHLFLGTNLDNILDRQKKGRQATGDKVHNVSHARLCGNANGYAKLTWAKVRRIRHEFQDGATKTALSRKYGVDRTNIYQVVTNKTWIEAEVTD